LRYAIVGGVDLSQVYFIPGTYQGIEKVNNSVAALTGKEALNILEDKRPRSVSGNEFSEHSYEGVSVVAVPPHASRREPLARRPTDDHVSVRKPSLLRDLVTHNVAA
jgi:hypothetical protein